jgi:glycosyltransferase involved in cell wall biosynthesis
MPPASVVIVSTYYPPVLGGAETAAAQLAAFLSARGHRVTVLTRRTARGVPDDEQREGVRVVRVAPRGPRTALGKWLAIPAIVMQLLKRRRGYDVVVCVDYRGVGLAALAARTFTGRPVIMQAATDGVLSFGAVRGMLARVGLGSLARWVIPPLQRLYNRANAYPCISRAIEAETLAAGVPRDRVSYLPNPVDAHAFSPADRELREALRARLNIAQDAVVAIVVGRLSREKGQMEALEAWRAAAPARALLVLVGPDMPGHPWDTGPAAREYVKLEGLQDSVVFVGGVPAERVPDYLRLADFCIQPSHFEAFGTAALEAMAAGLPVIASDVGGLKDFVEPGVNGLRVPPKDRVALANALTALVSDAGLRARLSEGARRTAVRYDIPHVLGQFAALIDAVAGGATSKPGLAGRQELGT